MAIYANLIIDQGSDFEALIEVEASGGTAADLSGYTVSGQMRRTYTSLTFYDLGATIINAPIGIVKLFISNEVTNNMKSGRYVYDVEVTSNDGAVTRVIEGQIEVTPGVTR